MQTDMKYFTLLIQGIDWFCPYELSLGGMHLLNPNPLILVPNNCFHHVTALVYLSHYTISVPTLYSIKCNFSPFVRGVFTGNVLQHIPITITVNSNHCNTCFI